MLFFDFFFSFSFSLCPPSSKTTTNSLSSPSTTSPSLGKYKAPESFPLPSPSPFAASTSADRTSSARLPSSGSAVLRGSEGGLAGSEARRRRSMATISFLSRPRTKGRDLKKSSEHCKAPPRASTPWRNFRRRATRAKSRAEEQKAKRKTR